MWLSVWSIRWHLQLRTGGFCWSKFYCQHALAGSNQRILIRQKTLEFSSTVLSYTDSVPSICQAWSSCDIRFRFQMPQDHIFKVAVSVLDCKVFIFMLFLRLNIHKSSKSVFSFLRQLTTWHCPHTLWHATLL